MLQLCLLIFFFTFLFDETCLPSMFLFTSLSMFRNSWQSLYEHVVFFPFLRFTFYVFPFPLMLMLMLMLIHILIQKRNINGNVNVNVIFNVIFFTLRFFVFYPLWRHSSLFLNKHVVFTSFVHPHSKTKQTHVNFSSFESLIRPLSHQHHSAIYTFYNHESPSFYESTKKKKNK